MGITAFTASANRAYEIAAAYRERSVPVVMGGIHPSRVAAHWASEVDDHAICLVVAGDDDQGLVEVFLVECVKNRRAEAITPRHS